MVEIHYANIALLWVDAVGNVIEKSDPSTRLETMRAATDQRHLILENSSAKSEVGGFAATDSSIGFPSVPEYLEREAALGFAIAYMDQFTVVTQKIT